MKAIIYQTFGEPAEILEVADLPKPEPKAGEALIRTLLSPIHNHDLWTARGSYGYKPELPAQGGTEALGIVEAVGEGVDSALIGQRVVKAGAQGTWAEYFVTPASAVLPLPDSISDAAGAQLIAMPFSALSLLESLALKPGDWLIQTAANGTVGKLIVDMARHRGLKLLNLVRRDEAVTEMLEFGAEHVLSFSDEQWQRKARELLAKEGARAAIDSVGGPIIADVADLLGLNGQLVVFGSSAGVPLSLNAGKLISNHVVVKGFWASRVIAEMPEEESTRLIGELVSLAVQHKLHLPSGGEFALDDIIAAVDASLTAGRSGKILLKPGH